MTTDDQHRFRVAIVGAGFGGLGMAIRLKQSGIEDFVVFERDEEVGGTWWANTYPGCQCDIPSHLYSYSFAPNAEWTRTYPLQPEIRELPARLRRAFGVRDHIRFRCPIERAEWDDAEGVWRLETPDGAFSAQFLIGAPGPLSEPSIPSLPGMDDFQGVAFHTARWNHDHDLTGRNVAVIGTGASAIQTVPMIQPQANHITIFQRTAPWVVPHRDRPITEFERRLYRRVPAAQRAVRTTVYVGRELLVTGLVYRPAADEHRAEDGRGSPGQAGPRRGAPRQADARLRDRLQAHPALEQVVSGDHQAQRRRRHRAPSASSAPTASSPPTAACTRSTP